MLLFKKLFRIKSRDSNSLQKPEGEISFGYINQFFHEVTPLLSAIDNQIESILELEGSRQAKQRLGNLQDTVYRLRALMSALHQLQVQVDERESQCEVCNLNTLIEISILQSKIRFRDARFRTEVSYGGNCHIMCNRSQIIQVINNLITNAFEACKTTPTARILITTKSFIIENERVVQLAITDNGPAIPKEIQKRIFEAGFTTKKGGKGYGLAISKKLVEQNNGSIQVESPYNLDKIHSDQETGAIFRIIFKKSEFK